MKRIIVLILSALVMFSFTSCNLMEKAEQAVVDIAKENGTEITRGTVEGNVYTSQFSGITVTAPENWEYMSNDELVTLTNESVGEVDASSIVKSLAELAIVFDMVVQDPEYGTNIMIMYENYSVIGETSSIEERVGDITDEISEESGGNYEMLTDETVTLGGESYRKLEFRYESEGIALGQAYYVRMIDDVVLSVVATYADGFATSAEIESMFS